MGLRRIKQSLFHVHVPRIERVRLVGPATRSEHCRRRRACLRSRAPEPPYGKGQLAGILRDCCCFVERPLCPILAPHIASPAIFRPSGIIVPRVTHPFSTARTRGHPLLEVKAWVTGRNFAQPTMRAVAIAAANHRSFDFWDECDRDGSREDVTSNSSAISRGKMETMSDGTKIRRR